VVLRYTSATGDREFDRHFGAELLIETARLWASVGHHARDDRFRIDGVTGPDEYSAVMDNNVYTNLMAQQNLNGALDAVKRQPSVAKRLKVSAAETKAWRAAADRMYIAYEPELRIHKQASQFTDHEVWDFKGTKPEQYPLFLHFPYFDIYRKQVIKQADLVLAMHVRGDAFSDEDKARNFSYYEAITVRDSSLSSCTQSIMASEVGHLQLAHDYLGEAALMDLRDLEHNVRDGVHMASLAGAWLAVVQGFGCMRHHGDWLGFSPRLPPGIRRVTFRVTFLQRHIRVSFDHRRVTYTLERGDALSFHHHDEEIRIARGKPVRRSLARLKPLPEPTQPAGRAPARRAPPRAQGRAAARPKQLRLSPPRSPGAPRKRGGVGLRKAAREGPPPTSAPRSRPLPSTEQPPSRRRPSKRSRARASAPRRRGP
jgi:alpha,alpha-trehalose phosphorylase